MLRKPAVILVSLTCLTWSACGASKAPVSVGSKSDATLHSADEKRTRARVLQRVAPKYPRAALDINLSGVSAFVARISALGTVSDVKFSKRHSHFQAVPLNLTHGTDRWQQVETGKQALIESGMTAVWQWRFTPATLNGKPVATKKLIKIDFRIQE